MTGKDPNMKLTDKARIKGCLTLLRYVEDQLRHIRNLSLEWLTSTRELELLLDDMEKWLAKYEGKDGW